AEPRRLAMVDREGGIARRLQRLGITDTQRCVLQSRGGVGHGRMPAAAVDVDDAVAVALLWTVDIHEQREAGIHPVDHVALDVMHGSPSMLEYADKDRRSDRMNRMYKI